ncbi:carboxypeptidase regulatory-like domain-containing protein [Allofranklinella schreckenbergeri]|uniref:Carboxypeptidase regulatory-like domain-containing protein n=1 Tax=Allofranklinella schreckenbergeri TaxID=1076744 RepID=A0A3M6QXT7_9BURK|nr:carboxypeptidase-like regulatory domain-containing protein [Allofranklinella schreckenbergeri]RMX07409.1 carboxypeptidase regulatory-like domain-containing protein [Allofranklinella schreckenbergeri]
MIAWLDIDGGDAACSVSLTGPADRRAAAAASGAKVLPLLAALSAIERPLSIPGIASAAASHMQASLDNGRAAITALWGDAPPLRRAARVMTLSPAGPSRVFEGLVTALELGQDARISLEAGLDRPLSDNLPLRTSAVWGGWRDVRVLPWAWGRVTLAPIQYSDDQRVYLLADHPIEGVDEVKRDDVPTQAYEWRNALDSTGHAVALLELAEPLAEGERLAVTLRGRMHPQTGRLLQTPAEIVHDVLAHLAGAPVQWADLDSYRTETAAIALGGVLADNSISIRAAIDHIIQSAGGAWSAGMRGIAMTWPPAADEAAPALRIDPRSAASVRASASATGICTVLRVLYDFDHAAGRYLRAIQLRAPDAARQYGELELEWPAPWLRTPRQAEALGQRMLAWLARPRWRVSWEQSFADAPTGAWVDIDHPLSPIQGRHRLIAAELDLAAASLRATVEGAVGAAPAIETVRLSSAFDPVIQPGITVEVADGEIIFTARDEQGRPLAGARIMLNGGATRIADNLGRVSFAAARGRHVLTIEADGYPQSEAVVVI